MLDSIEQLRKDADICTQMAGTENKFETVWITKVALLKDIDAIEQEIDEGYIELPKDADGEYIHIGDKLTGKYLEGNPIVECTRLALTNGWMVGHGRADGTPNLFVHHKPPTVEEVLREFALEIDPSADVDASGAKTIAEYATKLQVREAE